MTESSGPVYRSRMNAYLDAVFQGKNTWWRYMLSFAFIMFMWFVIGSIPVFIFGTFLLMDGNPETELSSTGFVGVDPLLAFLVTLSSFFAFFLAIFLSVRFIHGRPFRSLVTSQARVDWKRLLVGFIVWFIIAGLISLFEAILYPGRYTLSFDAGKFFIFSLFALLMIPIQTSSEELFFRGYLMQWLGLRLRNIILLPFLSGVIFGAMHLWNPEMSVDSGAWMLGLSYILVGAFAGLVTLIDGGLELALGLHAANNIYTALVANYSVSALPSQSVFTVNEIDPLYGLVSVIIGMTIFSLSVFYFFPKEGAVLEQGNI